MLLLLHQSTDLLVIILFLYAISISVNHPITVTAQSGGTNSTNNTTSGPAPYTGLVFLIFTAIIIVFAFIIYYIRERCFYNRRRRASYLQNSDPRLPTWRSTTQTSQPRGGVDSTLLQTFPVFKYSQAAAALTINIPDDDDQAREDENNKTTQECVVCLMAFEEKDELRLLPKCDHVFHKDCIDAWLADHTSCPFCRADLLSQDSAADGKRPIKGGATSESEVMSSTLTENRGPRDVRVVISTGDGTSRSGLSRKEEEVNRPRPSPH